MKNILEQILIIEDNLDYQEILEDFVALTDFSIKNISKVIKLSEALIFLKKNNVDLIFLDINLPDINNLTSITKIKGVRDVPIIVMTGLDEKEKSIEAIQLGAQDYIVKGEYDEKILEKAIYHSIERHRINLELEQLNESLDLKVVERTALLEDAMNDLREEIKKRKIVEQELRVSQRKIEESYLKEIEINELRSKIISTISHQYRNPLQNITTVSYILDKIAYTNEKSNKPIISYTNELRKSVKQITKFLDEVLEIQESSEIDNQNTYNVSLQDAVLSIVSYLSKINPKNQRININGEKLTYVKNIGDSVHQVILHLLTNALKYSPIDTDIIINISQEKNFAKIDIEDKGIGISEDEAKNIFNEFYRGNNAKKYEGTGLGLSLVSRKLQELNGKIAFESSLGLGTKFTVLLPLSEYEK